MGNVGVVGSVDVQAGTASPTLTSRPFFWTIVGYVVAAAVILGFHFPVIGRVYP